MKISKRKFGDNSEKKAAKKVLGKVVRGSGSSLYNKGDYETEDFLFQNKATSSKKYSLKIKDLEKAKKDALTKNKDFIFSIDMQGTFYYVFERILISEEQEKTIIYESIPIEKSKSLEKDVKNCIINDKYILLDEYSFLRLFNFKGGKNEK